MTIRDELLKQLDRLEEAKSLLLRKEQFLDPSNNLFVYSTEGISDLSGTDGTTPNNLKEALEKIVEATNQHIKVLKTMPVVMKEQEIINQIDKTYALVENNSQRVNPPLSWNLEEASQPIESLAGYMSSSLFYTAIKTLKITSSSRFLTNSGTAVDFEISLRKINTRTSTVDYFRGVSGNLNVTILGDNIDPDDIFIIGVDIHETIDLSSLYFTDFTYTIEREYYDGRTESNISNIANTKIGNSSIKADPIYSSKTSLISANIYWDMITINNFAVEIESKLTSEAVALVDGNSIFRTSDVGDNSLLSIKLNRAAMEFEAGMYSAYTDTSYFRVLGSDNYDIYSISPQSGSSFYVPNARPIDTIIKEALNAL